MPLFNGVNRILPGAYTRTDASGLITTGLAPGGIVGMIGTAGGGEPNRVYRINSSVVADETFKEGKLLDAMKAAWLNGANDIYAVRIGLAQRSVITLIDSTSGDVLSLESRDWGTWTNNIEVKVDSGSDFGYKISIRYVDENNRVTLESSTGPGAIPEYDNILTTKDLAEVINEFSSLIKVKEIHDEGAIVSLINYTKLIGGSDGVLNEDGEITTTLQDWTDALRELEVYPVNILNPAEVDAPEVHGLFLQHCIEMSSKEAYRFCIVGGGENDPVGDVMNPSSDPLSSVGRAFNLNHERVVFVATGVNDRKAAYTASMVAGKLAGFDPATSLTYKTLVGVRSINVRYTHNQKEDLLVRGCIAIEEAPAGRRVLRDITTKQDIRPGITEDAFKDITTLRISDYINVNARNILQDLYVGKKGVKGARNSIANTCVDILNSLREDEIITNFRNIQVIQDESNPKIFRVNMEVVPIFTITWIFITTTLTNN